MMQSLSTSFEKMQGSTNALCDMNKVLSVISLGFNKSLQNLIQTVKLGLILLFSILENCGSREG